MGCPAKAHLRRPEIDPWCLGAGRPGRAYKWAGRPFFDGNVLRLDSGDACTILSQSVKKSLNWNPLKLVNFMVWKLYLHKAVFNKWYRET